MNESINQSLAEVIGEQPQLYQVCKNLQKVTNIQINTKINFLSDWSYLFHKDVVIKKWIFLCIFKLWFGQGGYIFLLKFFSEKAKHLRMCPSIGSNVGETWLRRGPIITQPYYSARPTIKAHNCMVAADSAVVLFELNVQWN